MKCDRKILRLYAVTDRAWVGGGTLEQQVEAALKGGATCVQLREKGMHEEELLQEALRMKEICRRYGVPLIINDHVEVALHAGADGVHVGQQDMPVSRVRELAGDRLMVGVSARTVEQALEAERGGADYLGAGAVFGTSTKQDARFLPYETLQAICRAVSIPVCAIGGINREN
ncbi:MAG: thiamine phosphate synthase, partial [Oscillospiraceae bacterium]|nr:thiamine phosphate synthase [Oscillospiraceae bacterium]